MFRGRRRKLEKARRTRSRNGAGCYYAKPSEHSYAEPVTGSVAVEVVLVSPLVSTRPSLGRRFRDIFALRRRDASVRQSPFLSRALGSPAPLFANPGNLPSQFVKPQARRANWRPKLVRVFAPNARPAAAAPPVPAERRRWTADCVVLPQRFTPPRHVLLASKACTLASPSDERATRAKP